MPNRCAICGGWNDATQWPEEERESFDPFLCYTCARQEHIRKDDELEEVSDSITPEEEAAELDASEKELEGGGDYDD